MSILLSTKTIQKVKEDIASFDVRYKHDWQSWMAVHASGDMTAAESVVAFRGVLRKWQAVRSGIKGRVVRMPKSSGTTGLCLDDLLTDVVDSVKSLGTTTVRDLRTISESQRAALEHMWNVFRDLPTEGPAHAVGITKAILLLTGGRIGPALDSKVRRQLGVKEPRTPEAWLSVLELVAQDLYAFESKNECSLESLVEPEWQPVAVGRAYDMVFGPKAKP